MKRCLAFAALFLICAGPVTADYLFIKIDLNKINFSGGGAGGGPEGGGIGLPPGAGQFGGAPGGGFPGGVPGGAFGKKGKGGGFPGGAQPGGGFPGGAQPGGGFPGGAQPGGAFPGGGQPGGGFPGGGAPGVGFPGGGAPGAMMMMQGAPGQFGAQGGNAESDLSSHVILTYIELKSPPKVMQQPQQPPSMVEADHRWGRKGRFPLVPIVQYTHVRKDSVGKEFTKKYGRDVTEAKEPGRLYYAATWALGHGLTKDFHNAMAALTKADPKHYAAVEYARVQAALKKAPTLDDPASQNVVNDVKGEGFRLTISEAGHYGLFTKPPHNESAIKRRLARFEEAYENLFYWFALQENAVQPALPKYRLYAVLVDVKSDFDKYHNTWGSLPMVADAFTPRRDNLIVLSAKRLDENYAIFEKNTQMLWTKGVSREDLVSGAIWEKTEAKNNVMTFAAFQTLAIMQKAMDEEGERAAISHEATRQLLSASGILPRLVNVPEWIQVGMSSYFDTPHGALYGGVGLPSWSNLVAFKYFRKSNRLGGSPNEALLRTISDRFFRDAHRTEAEQKDLPEKARSDSKVKDELDIARGTSWALTYYLLSSKKLPQLLRYTQELNNLPRDLELDERTLLACFGRAFDLMDPKDARRLDLVKTRAFADAWFSQMLEENLEVPEAEEIFTALRTPIPRKTQNFTNQPGFPGGPLAPPGVVQPGLAPPGVVQPGLAPPGVQPRP